MERGVHAGKTKATKFIERNPNRKKNLKFFNSENRTLVLSFLGLLLALHILEQ